MYTWRFHYIYWLGLLYSLLIHSIAIAQPSGSIDPLYDHLCNEIVDVTLAKLTKSEQKTRLQALDPPYTRAMELLATGRLQEALTDFLSYLESVSKYVALTHHLYHDALYRVATVRKELRSYAQAFIDAQAVFETRQKCFGLDNRFTLEALTLLASLYQSTGQWNKALEASDLVLNIYRQLLERQLSGQTISPASQKQLLIAEANVAATAYRAAQWNRARDGARRTVQAAAALPANDLERHELANSSWYIINRIAHRTHSDEEKESITALEESYRALQSLLGQDHPRTFPLLSNFGFAVADLNPKEAFPILGDYVALMERERLRTRLPADRQILLEARANTYQRFAFTANEVQRTLDAFYGIEWSKARSLTDTLSLRLALADGTLPSGDVTVLRELEQQIAAFEGKLESTTLDTSERQAIAKALQEAKSNYQQKFSAAESASSHLRIAAQSRIQNPRNATALLKPDEVFVSYLTRRIDGPQFDLMVAVLEPSGKLTIAGLGPILGLDSTVSAFVEISSRRGGLSEVAEDRELRQIGKMFFLDPGEKSNPEAKLVTSFEVLRKALSDQLLPHSVRALIEPYQRWIISPAGPLWGLPFEALTDGTGLVLDSRFVRYVHSWTMLSLVNEASKFRSATYKTPVLALGAAIYSDYLPPPNVPRDRYKPWSELPYSAQEIEQVKRDFGLIDGETVFQGKKAVRQTILDLNARGRLARTRLILLSAHGFLNAENPALSAVVLGKPSDQTEAERYLTARDIAQLDLRAELVVVSSCESGLGRVAAGEGMLGLTYAFFSAGALNSVLTSWKIYDDPSTAALVNEFLLAVHKGSSIDVALTAAKRSLRKTKNEAYWAPFLLLGR